MIIKFHKVFECVNFQDGKKFDVDTYSVGHTAKVVDRAERHKGIETISERMAKIALSGFATQVPESKKIEPEKKAIEKAEEKKKGKTKKGK